MSADSGLALVVGSGGQVGGALVERLGGAVIGTGREREPCLDLETAARRSQDLDRLFREHTFDVAFIAAGMTRVDDCEQHPKRAFAINRDGPAAVAAAARGSGARSVYFSTEYVFDGASGPYHEEHPTSPISVYGRSKLEGEEAVLAADPHALVLRTTVVYGPELQGKNFAYQLALRLGSGQVMRVPGDQVSSPTYNRDLAKAAVRLAAAKATGIYNAVGPEVLGRGEFARALARLLDLDAALVEEVPTSSLGQLAPRPLQAGLEIEKIQREIDFRPRSVEQAIEDWLAHPRGKPWPG